MGVVQLCFDAVQVTTATPSSEFVLVLDVTWYAWAAIAPVEYYWRDGDGGVGCKHAAERSWKSNHAIISWDL